MGAKGLVAFNKVYPNVHIGVVRVMPEHNGQLLQVGALVCPIGFGKEAVFNADEAVQSTRAYADRTWRPRWMC